MSLNWGGRYLSEAISLLIVSIFMCGSVTAGPVGLPDSARPGAVRPEQEEAPVPREPPAEVLEVPAVIDRPFDVEDCPCVVVNSFRLLDAEDMPEFDVKVEEIQVVLDDLVEQQPEGGYSIGQLQEAANEVRNYYRKKGLILAQVVVPVQTVEGGVVDLQTYVGRLGRVLAEGNEIYKTEILEQAFSDLIGQPISQATIEAALLRLTDYPGLTVFGVFQPGQLVGTADIVIKIQEERRFDVAMRIDNQGTQETGRARFRTVIDWNNPTGGADKISMTVQQSYRPKENVFYALDYERNLARGYKVGFMGNRNPFDVGGQFKAQQISAETDDWGAFVEKSIIRSRQENLALRMALNSKDSVTKRANVQTNRDGLTVLSFEATYDSVDIEDQGINFATLEFSRGFNDRFGAMGSAGNSLQLAPADAPSRRGGSGDLASGQFAKVFGTYTRLQTVSEDTSLLFRSELFWSDDLLVPLEQYSIGGPDHVRGYSVAEELFDRAFFFSIEYFINAPFIADKPAFANRTWGELLQFSLFYDHVVGRKNDPLVNEKQSYQNFKGLGFGFRFNVPGTIESRLFWAWAYKPDEVAVGPDVANDRFPQVWGDLTYRF